MKDWNIYFEHERTGERIPLGNMLAETMERALHLAAQYFEVPLQSLIAIQQVTTQWKPAW